MNILIIASDFKPKSGGIAEITHQIARHLDMGGDKVTVLTRNMGGALEFDNKVDYNVYRHEPFNFGDRYGSKKIGLRATLSKELYKVIRKITDEKSIDMIINSDIGIAHYCLPISRLLDVPFCVFTWGLGVNKIDNKIKEIKTKFIVRNADKIISCSNFTKNIVKELGGKDISVVHPGISESTVKEISERDIKQFKKKFDIGDEKILLSIGRLVKRKGFDKTIKALKKVKKEYPDITYILGGSGPIEKELKQMAERLDLNDNIIFPGFVDEDMKPILYEISDVFLMPSRELENGDVEGFGIVFLEANEHELPVIGGRSGGVPDAVEDGKNGLLVNPNDENDIADAIIKLLNNPDLAKKLGEEGKKRAKEEFNWPKLVGELKEEITPLKENY